jgi:hypothetical protein
MRRSALSSFVAAALVVACGGERKAETEGDNWPGEAAGPAGMGLGVRVFSGTAATLSASRSCTAEEGAEGDRWCVFIGLSSSGEHNLFALNVSQVIAGVPVSCDTPDPNCLLLTNHVLGSSADFHPSFFAGDTLVYYDETLTPRVWRPGMAGGRVLASRATTLDIAFCTPASRGLAVACLGVPSEQPDTSILAADLYVGAADGESEPLLAPVDSVIVASLADTETVQRFALGSPASGYVAWSSRETTDGPEVLKVQACCRPRAFTTAPIPSTFSTAFWTTRSIAAGR